MSKIDDCIIVNGNNSLLCLHKLLTQIILCYLFIYCTLEQIVFYFRIYLISVIITLFIAPIMWYLHHCPTIHLEQIEQYCLAAETVIPGVLSVSSISVSEAVHYSMTNVGSLPHYWYKIDYNVKIKLQSEEAKAQDKRILDYNLMLFKTLNNGVCLLILQGIQTIKPLIICAHILVQCWHT